MSDPPGAEKAVPLPGNDADGVISAVKLRSDDDTADTANTANTAHSANTGDSGYPQSEEHRARTESLLGTPVAGGYKLIEWIGSGGMSDVFRAEHKLLGKFVAVKVMQHRSGKRRKEMKARFQNEARTIAKLKHPNIVDVLDSGFLEDGSPYIVMELLEGVALGQYLKQAQLTPDEVTDLAVQLCAGLSVAHRQGVVHRDVKPENAFLIPADDGWSLKILDFGIAKLDQDGDDEGHKTRTQAVLGTPQYMSPEQARRASEVTAASDIYSTGVLLYRMLTGSMPYDVTSAGELVFYVMSKKGDLADMEQCPVAWRHTLKQCLTSAPASRFQDANELLIDILAHVPDAADAVIRHMPEEAEALLQAGGVVRQTTGRRRRQKAAFKVMALAVGLLAVVGAAIAVPSIAEWLQSREAIAERAPVAEPAAPAEDGPLDLPAADAPSPTPPSETGQGDREENIPDPSPIRVQFTTRPSGATVAIRELEMEFRTPGTTSVPEGTYLVEARKAGFRPWREEVTVNRDNTQVRISLRALRRQGLPQVNRTPPPTMEAPTRPPPRRDPDQLFRSRL